MMTEAGGLSAVPLHPLTLIAEVQGLLRPDVTDQIEVRGALIAITSAGATLRRGV